MLLNLSRLTAQNQDFKAKFSNQAFHDSLEDVSKSSPSIDAMMISYGCVYKRSSKPVIKGSRVETIEAARKEYTELL